HELSYLFIDAGEIESKTLHNEGYDEEWLKRKIAEDTDYEFDDIYFAEWSKHEGFLIQGKDDDGYVTEYEIIFICTNERLKAWEYAVRVQVDIMVLRKTTRNEEVRMMGHDHHDHTHGANKKALLLSFILIASFMVIEAIGGWLTNSLALLADAGHMFSDAVSLAIALVAFKFGEKVADYSKTYGYK